MFAGRELNFLNLCGACGCSFPKLSLVMMIKLLGCFLITITLHAHWVATQTGTF